MDSSDQCPGRSTRPRNRPSCASTVAPVVPRAAGKRGSIRGSSRETRRTILMDAKRANLNAEMLMGAPNTRARYAEDLVPGFEQLACELARLLEETGQPYVEIDLAGTPLVGFRCPFCGFLAWCNPSVPSVSFHDGQGCARYHALGRVRSTPTRSSWAFYLGRCLGQSYGGQSTRSERDLLSEWYGTRRRPPSSSSPLPPTWAPSSGHSLRGWPRRCSSSRRSWHPPRGPGSWRAWVRQVPWQRRHSKEPS